MISEEDRAKQMLWGNNIESNKDLGELIVARHHSIDVFMGALAQYEDAWIPRDVNVLNGAIYKIQKMSPKKVLADFVFNTENPSRPKSNLVMTLLNHIHYHSGFEKDTVDYRTYFRILPEKRTQIEERLKRMTDAGLAELELVKNGLNLILPDLELR